MIPCSQITQDCRYGYARVSSKSQEDNSSLASQKKELLAQGIPEKNIWVEIGSASDTIQDRPIFNSLIQHLKQNDILFVTKLDRCSRNTREFLNLQQKLFEKSVTFIALDIPYSNDVAANKLIATTMAAIATFETDRRKSRQQEGILAAKKAGKYLGRKTVITPKLVAQVRELKETKQLSITQIAKLTGKGRNTIYKILKQELHYIPYSRLVKNSFQEETKETKETK